MRHIEEVCSLNVDWCCLLCQAFSWLFSIQQVNCGVVHLGGLCTVSYKHLPFVIYLWNEYGAIKWYISLIWSCIADNMGNCSITYVVQAQPHISLLFWRLYTDSLSVLIRSFLNPSEVSNTRIVILSVAICRRRIGKYWFLFWY